MSYARPTPGRKRSPSPGRPGAGYKPSSRPASARCASGSGTPWRRLDSRARWRRGSSVILRRGFQEGVFQAALELVEGRDLDPGRCERLEDGGRRGIVALVLGLEGAVDRRDRVDHGQRFEQRRGLLLLTEDRDSQAPAAGQLPNDVLHRPGRSHPTLVDDADHGAELGELWKDVARDHDRLAHSLEFLENLAHLDPRTRIES